MPAGHWRAFSTKRIGIDSNLRHSFGGTTPDQAIGSQIHFPEQGLGPKTASVTLLRPSVHTQDLVARPVSPRGIKVSDPCSQDPGGKNRISLAPPPSDHLDSLGHYYLSIYVSDRHAQQLVEWGMRRSVSAPKGADYFEIAANHGRASADHRSECVRPNKQNLFL